MVGYVPAAGEQRQVTDGLLDPRVGLVHLCSRLEVSEVVVAMDDRCRDPIRLLTSRTLDLAAGRMSPRRVPCQSRRRHQSPTLRVPDIGAFRG